MNPNSLLLSPRRTLLRRWLLTGAFCAGSLFGAPVTTFTGVEVLFGAASVSDATSLNGCQTFDLGFPGPGGSYAQVSACYNGTAAASAGVLRTGISYSAGSVSFGPSPTGRFWAGMSGAAIAEWQDTWTITTNAGVSFANFTFQIDGNGPADINLYGSFDDNTAFSLVQAVDGTGTRALSVAVPLGDHGNIKTVKMRFIAGGDGFGNFPFSYSSHYEHTVTLTGLSMTNSGGTEVPFTLTTASGDPFFAALVPNSVPEPGTWLLSGLGLTIVTAVRKRRL